MLINVKKNNIYDKAQLIIGGNIGVFNKIKDMFAKKGEADNFPAERKPYSESVLESSERFKPVEKEERLEEFRSEMPKPTPAEEKPSFPTDQYDYNYEKPMERREAPPLRPLTPEMIGRRELPPIETRAPLSEEKIEYEQLLNEIRLMRAKQDLIIEKLSLMEERMRRFI